MMGRLRRLLFEASFLFVVAVCALTTLFTVGPWVETRFFPPVSKLTILSLKDNGDGTSTIEAYFTKTRDCTYVGIAWYHGKRAGEFERVPVQLGRKEGDVSSPNRPVGSQRAGPWIVGLPADELKAHSFAQLAHNCEPFWTTTTDFYP